MTSLRAARATGESDATASRRRRGVVLIIGALFMEVFIQQGAVKFYYTPLVVGLAYLIGAAVSGRRGALWVPGLVVTCWGVSVLLVVHNVVSNPNDLAYDVAALVGLALALLLRVTAGVSVGAIGVVVSLGVVVLHNYTHLLPSWVFHGYSFALMLGIWGLWELRPGRRSGRDGAGAGTAAADRAPDLDRV